MNIKTFIVEGHDFRLKNYYSSFTGKYQTKEEAKRKMNRDLEKLASLQERLYAQNTWGVLLVFQGMDAAGKDSTVKHIMSGVNPAGCQVASFKAPSSEELDHDYLWRCVKVLPERGRIGVFIRSYYEEVLVVRVHREILAGQHLPWELKDKDIWKRRFKEIKNFEAYLQANGILVLKFFLNISKDEQRKRFLERINNPNKNWKFSFGDIKKRKLWAQYARAYEDMIRGTSTIECPWYVIPADYPWFARAAVADVIVNKLEELNLEFPRLSSREISDMRKVKKLL